MSIAQLLKLPGYVIALILGRPTGLAFVYIDHVPLLVAIVLAPVVLTAWATWSLRGGSWLLNFACTRHNRWSRKLATRVEARKAEKLSWWQMLGVVVIGVMPTVGFPAAIGLATATSANADPKVQRRLAQRLAFLIGSANALSFIGALLLIRHIPLPPASTRPIIESLSLPLIGSVAAIKLIRHFRPKIHLPRPRLRLALPALMRITGLLH